LNCALEIFAHLSGKHLTSMIDWLPWFSFLEKDKHAALVFDGFISNISQSI
jgi:hypothetical protein